MVDVDVAGEDCEKLVSGAADGSKPIYTKVFGVTFEGRQEVAKTLTRNHVLLLRRDPGNQYDKNAVMVLAQGDKQVGFLGKQLAAELAPLMDSGVRFSCMVKQVTGGSEKQSWGVNIVVSRLENG